MHALLCLVLAAAAHSVVVPVRLSRPVYPTIAASARIAGDVEVAVQVRPDGSVESAAIVSGLPLLNETALKAARSSLFECRGCGEATTPYSVVFAFRLVDRLPVGSGSNGQPQAIIVTPSQSRVIIVAETSVIDDVVYAGIVRRARSPKCLWLWKCGFR